VQNDLPATLADDLRRKRGSCNRDPQYGQLSEYSELLIEVAAAGEDSGGGGAGVYQTVSQVGHRQCSVSSLVSISGRLVTQIL